MVKKMNYLKFRSNALQSLAIAGKKNFKSKDDVERWIKKEYKRHYNKRK